MKSVHIKFDLDRALFLVLFFKNRALDLVDPKHWFMCAKQLPDRLSLKFLPRNMAPMLRIFSSTIVLFVHIPFKYSYLFCLRSSRTKTTSIVEKTSRSTESMKTATTASGTLTLVDIFEHKGCPVFLARLNHVSYI